MAPSVSPWVLESFDTTSSGIPANWSQWSSDGGTVFAVESTNYVSPSHGLGGTTTASTESARAWLSSEPALGDVQVTASVYLNNSHPTLPGLAVESLGLVARTEKVRLTMRLSFHDVREPAEGKESLP